MTVVGSGPNGLAAAIHLARAGLSVKVIEAAAEVGGGLRSAELTLPGFVHDVCASVMPLALASPFFAGLPLEEYGVRWVHPELPLAHPLDGLVDGLTPGSGVRTPASDGAVVISTDLAETAGGLGLDSANYHRLVAPLVEARDELLATFLGPLNLPTEPRALLATARFGLPALSSARLLATTLFRTERARALFGGLAAHAIQPLDRPGTASFGLMLALLAHRAPGAGSGRAHGWPFVEGGSGRLAAALAAYFVALGGEIETCRRVDDIDELNDSRFVLLDVAPKGALRIAGKRLHGRYRRALEHYRYGPGVFKLDLALSGPVPWSAGACRRAGTVHVGGTLGEIAAAESLVWRGVHPRQPYVLVAQPSLFDASRAPAGKHTLWSYCHVPNGSTVDMTEPILAQLQRFAPGVRDLVLATHGRTASEYETYDANFVGGDINAGVQDLRQQFTRPAVRVDPYSTPDERVYICSSATPPGGGVHGMSGLGAARALLRRLRLERTR